MNKNINNNDANASTVELRVLLSDIWRGVIKFGWIAVALAVLLGGLQFYRSYVRFTPIYKVSATFTVHTENAVLSGDNGVSAYSFYYNRNTADQLASVFPHVVSNTVLKQRVCDDLGVAAMPATVTASCVAGTNMITLVSSGSDAKLTYDTLLSVIDNYSSVADFIIGRTKLVMINEPVLPAAPSNTGAWVSSVMRAALIGLVIGFGWIMVYAILRKTIRTKDDIRNVLNQHCIGVLPQVVFKKYRRKINTDIVLTNPHIGGDFLESLRLIRSSLQKSLKENEKIVMVTSTAPAEGKSVVTVNLASVFAKDDKTVLVIDADLRHSGINSIVYGENEQLENKIKKALASHKKNAEDKAKDAAKTDETLSNCKLPQVQFNVTKEQENDYYTINHIDDLGFDLLTYKSGMDNIQKIMRVPELKDVFEAFRDEYDLILVDTPPCGVISDATIIAGVVDAAVYVIRQDAVMQASIRTGINAILESDVKFTGCILNGAAGGIGGYGNYYKYGGYYKYYRGGYSHKYGYSNRYGKEKKKSSSLTK